MRRPRWIHCIMVETEYGNLKTWWVALSGRRAKEMLDVWEKSCMFGAKAAHHITVKDMCDVFDMPLAMDCLHAFIRTGRAKLIATKT